MALIFLNGGGMRGGPLHSQLQGTPMVCRARSAAKYRYFSVRGKFPAMHESGSASGTLTAIQQLGAALGTAVIGTLFFDLLERRWSFGSAMQAAVWVEIGLLALTFGLSFLLPLRPRPEQAGH